jgi:hypothetical protein
MEFSNTDRTTRANGNDGAFSFYGTDTVVSGYARTLTRHWETLSNRVSSFVTGDDAGSTQRDDSLGASGEMSSSGRILKDILGTPVVTKFKNAVWGDDVSATMSEQDSPQPLSYRASQLCEDLEFSVVAAFRAAQQNAKHILSSLDLGLRAPQAAVSTGVEQ